MLNVLEKTKDTKGLMSQWGLKDLFEFVSLGSFIFPVHKSIATSAKHNNFV